MTQVPGRARRVVSRAEQGVGAAETSSRIWGVEVSLYPAVIKPTASGLWWNVTVTIAPGIGDGH